MGMRVLKETLKERPIEIASKSKDIETNVSTVEREMEGFTE